jgi:serine/threonine-protein kinase
MLTSIGEFEVKSELGHGGMGTVYLAYDPRVGRDVAIKVLSNEGDGDLLARFRSEAGTTAKLTHKNIVTIYAFGEQDGMPYIVMELLQGENLGEVISKRRPLTLLEKVRILHQVAEGLSFAHQKNVIHRDIKPRNIMLLPDGTAKVMDFGIARVTGSDSTRRTQKGYLLGTIAYMAPEQFTRGMDADQLVDIFAYGDVAYELITGEHPFGEGEAGALISRITATEPRAIRELAPDCPELLASIIQQLLAKDRDLRYQSLRDLVLDMEPVLFQLRHDRAAQILAEAHPLVEQGQVDAALAKVKEAVELDPMNREADQLKKQLQEDLRRKAVRGKVTAMVADAERKVAQRSFSEAILVLESALQLDKTDTIQARLEEVRREQEKVKRAVQLLGEARRQENLGTAVAKAAEALEIDPHNTQAPHVLKRLREELDKRARRLREALQAASACAAKQVFDEAFRILDKVAEEQGELPEIAEERGRVQAVQAEFKLRQRWRSFDEGVVSARAAMNGGNLAQARAVIESLATGYADLPHAAAERTKQLAEDLARRERETEIARIAQEADDLSRQEQFEAGHAKLDAALARYPGDPALQAALEKLLQAKAARERADAIAVGAANISRLHREGALEPALQAAKAAAGEYPEYKEFQDLVTEIAAELQERQRRARIDEAARRATALLESDPSQAGELLQSTLAEVGPEAYLESLLTAAQRAAGRRQEQQVVNQILAQVQKLRASQKWREALDELDRAIEQYPRRSELRLSASEVRAELDRIARAEKLRATNQAIQEALAGGDLHKCGTLIDEARKEFRGEAGIEQLAAELARAQRSQRLTALTASVRQSLSRDDVEGAARQLAGSSDQLAATPEWNALKTETDERRLYLSALEKAGQLAGQSRFGEAEQLLAAYVKAGHKRAGQMQRTIVEQRVRAEEEARERERKEAEARELERKEQERKTAEARELERKEQERKAAEALALERKEQERKAAEARERERKEKERKAAEALALERKEQERKAAEALALERKEQDRKAAEALALERKEQERKAAEARERERKEQERKAAEARELQRKERERKAAEARLEQERRERERRERQEREAEDLDVTLPMTVDQGETIAIPVPSAPPAAKAEPPTATVAASAALRQPEPEPVEPTRQTVAPTFGARTVTEAPPIYRRPVVIVPVALAVLALGYFIVRPKPVPSGPTPAATTAPATAEPAPAPPVTPAPVKAVVDKKILPMNKEFPAWQVDTPQPSPLLIPIPEEQLRLIHPHWQKANDERWFHFKTVSGGLSLSVTTTGMTVGNNSANLVLDLPDGDYHQVVVSITVERGLEYKQQRDSIRWQGSLSPKETLTIQGTTCSQGNLVAGELPDKPFKAEAAKLKQESGLTVEAPPSAQNRYTLRLRNSGSATLTSFTLFYRAAK